MNPLVRQSQSRAYNLSLGSDIPLDAPFLLYEMDIGGIDYPGDGNSLPRSKLNREGIIWEKIFRL